MQESVSQRWRFLWVAGVFFGLLGGLAGGQADLAGVAPRPKLVVATKEAPPFVLRQPGGGLTGLSIELWELVAAKAGMDFEYKEMDLGQILRGVELGEVDAGVAAITVTMEREERMDFTFPYFSAGLGLAYEERPHSMLVSIVRNFFSWAFLSSVVALVLVLLGAGALVWMFERKENKEQFGGKPLEGLGSGLWWSAVTMTTVGYGDKAPRTAAGRVVGLIWMFTSVVVISSFTASIASSVTVDRLDSSPLKVKSLETLQYATVESSTGEAFARTHGLRQVPFETLEAALDSLAGGQVDAVLHDIPLLKYRALQEPSRNLSILARTLEPADYAIALPTGSPHRERLNRAIIEAIREDRWDRLQRQYLGN